MPFRLDIPGQVSVWQLRAIEAIARLVPPGGTVVEVGSLFGRSSWAWGASVDPSVEVFCVDPWERNAGVRSMEIRHGMKYGLAQFVEFTKDLPNIRPLRGYSPDAFSDWERPIDLYYEDAVHTDPVLARNLAFWTGKLKPAGIVCGDDYRPRFPDVRRGAHALATRLGRELIQVENFWCLLPSESECPGAAQVAAALRTMARDVDIERRKLGFQMSIGPRLGMPAVAHGSNPIVPIRVANESLDPWPEAVGDGRSLVASVHVFTGDAQRRLVGEARASIGVSRLEPDMPVDFDLELPLANSPPGNYLAVFGLMNPDGGFAAGRDPNTASGASFRVDAAPAVQAPPTAP